MTKILSHKSVKAAEYIRGLFPSQRFKPRHFLVLGSGFRDVSDHWTTHQTIKFKHIPYFPVPAVSGHGDELRLARARVSGEEIDVLVATGRVHLYEGYSPGDVCFPVTVAAALGIKSIILTNAAGGVSESATPGTIMAISDHLNLMGTNVTASLVTGSSVEFTDMTDAYNSPWLRHLTAKFNLATGVYAGLAGPSFETAAEARMLRVLGADLAGMSTVQETIAARSLGLDVLGLSFVTNLSGRKSDHTEVLRLVREKAPSIREILEASLEFSPENR